MNIIKKILIIGFIQLFLINSLTCFSTEDILNQEEIVSEEQEENAEESIVEESQVEVDEYGLRIYSEAAIMIEKTTGKILYEKNKDQRMYPASTTKILTAIIAIENCSLDEDVEISQNAIDSLKSGYTKSNMQVGEHFTLEEVLDVMILQSANEAAVAIAEHVSRFCR